MRKGVALASASKRQTISRPGRGQDGDAAPIPAAPSRANFARPGAAAAGFRRAGRLALAVPRPCPRVQRPLQLVRGDERRRDQRRADIPMAAGSARRAPSPRPAPTGRRAGPISPIRSTRSGRGSRRARPVERKDGKPLSDADRKHLATLNLDIDVDRRALQDALHRAAPPLSTPTTMAATAATRKRCGR